MPSNNICMHMAHVSFYICCSNCVGSVGMCVMQRMMLIKIVGFSLGVLKYVVCLCKECDGCFMFVL